MSRELDILAKEYSKKSVSVLRKDINLFGKNLAIELSVYAREVERVAKKLKRGSVTVVAVISE